jgi:hypothetical protein
LVFVIAAVTACSTKAPRQTRLMKSTEMTISAAALRVQVRSLAGRFSGLMEEAGEQALQNEIDPVIRRNALLWLTNGIPAMQQALFQSDPLAALLDAWFLIAQMRGYFSTAADHGMPPENVEIANRVLDEMESDIKLIIENAGPDTDYEHGRDLIYGYAEKTPIDESFSSRRGSAVFLAEFTARAGGSALRSIGSVTETLEDLVARIDVNAEYVPKLVRWQAMLLIIDQDFGNIGPALENLAHIEFIASEVESLAPIVVAIPELVAEERIAVLEALDAYLSRTLAFINQQRTTLMTNDVRAEREAVLRAIREERIAVLEAIADERRIILEALREERVATFDDLDQLMDEAFSREVNKLFARGLILIAIILGGFATITFLGVRALKRRTD